MTTEIGKRVWTLHHNGGIQEMVNSPHSNTTPVWILNPSNHPTNINLMFYADSCAPIGPHNFTIPAGRSLHITPAMLEDVPRFMWEKSFDCTVIASHPVIVTGAKTLTVKS